MNERQKIDVFCLCFQEPSSKVAADESEAPRRTSSVLDMLGEEDDEDVEVPQQKDETKSQKPAEKAAKKSSGKVSKRDDARKPMDSEENSQEKRKKIIPKIAKFLMSNDKPKRKRSSGVMNGRRARMDEAEGSKRPNKVPRTERESTRRISLKTMVRVEMHSAHVLICHSTASERNVRATEL